MTLKTKDIIGGFIIFLISAGLYAYNWYLIFNEPVFYPKAAFIGGAMMIVGLGLMIFGGYRTERINRGEDISKLSGSALLTPKWWGILIVAILFGLVNWIYVQWAYAA